MDPEIAPPSVPLRLYPRDASVGIRPRRGRTKLHFPLSYPMANRQPILLAACNGELLDENTGLLMSETTWGSRCQRPACRHKWLKEG